MTPAYCSGSSSRSTFFSKAPRSSANSGKAVNSASSTASRGTSDSMVVKVRLAAAWSSRTSRAWRAAKFTTSPAHSRRGRSVARRRRLQAG